MIELLEIVKAVGRVTVQGAGWRGRMHEGLAWGGALVPSLLARANRRVGNSVGDNGIELTGQLVVRALRDVIVATDRKARELVAGETMTIASGQARVTYVTVTNGVEGPNGGETRLSAGIGALLRAGDRVRAAPGLLRTPRIVAIADELAPERVGVIAGPDLDAFALGALEQLTSSEWRIGSSSDRVGTRLEGATIARRSEYVEQSRPMIIGAIEVPRDGAPIVLGPEHPTTGGYPIVAVIATESLDAFHAIAHGGRVRFHCV